MLNKNKLLIVIVIFFLSLLLRVATIDEIGRTWDEPEYVEQGHKMVELYKKGDVDNSFFYTTYDHPPLLKYLYGFIKAKVKEGKKVYVYGASTRGNTLLQYFNLDNKLIEKAVERNPEKWRYAELHQTRGTRSTDASCHDDDERSGFYFNENRNFGSD